MDKPGLNLRVRVLQAVVIVAFASLSAQLWRLQIERSEDFQMLADRNRFRLVSVDAARGVIYDRRGLMLVRNVPRYAVSIVPAALPEDDERKQAVLARLAHLLGMPVSSRVASVGAMDAQPGIEEILEENTTTPYASVTIKDDVDKQLAFLIEEEHLFLPGAIVQVTPRREYPTGAVTSHLLGYVGSIPAEDAAQYLRRVEEDYAIGDSVGLMGVEAAFEHELRGRKGFKHIEVNAFERELRVLAIDPPQPGNNLMLTLDSDLQRAAESALREGMHSVGSTAGVVIAMDPQSGQVLAMVSLPSYDNNLFARGISMQEYAELSAHPEHPLVNHAISGQYPPGSTFKIVAAAAGLEEQVIDLRTRLSCGGELLLPNRYFRDDPAKAQSFKCWYEWGHGSLDILGAIALSCDIYFYQVGGGLEEFQGLWLWRDNGHLSAWRSSGAHPQRQMEAGELWRIVGHG